MLLVTCSIWFAQHLDVTKSVLGDPEPRVQGSLSRRQGACFFTYVSYSYVLLPYNMDYPSTLTYTNTNIDMCYQSIVACTNEERKWIYIEGSEQSINYVKMAGFVVVVVTFIVERS